MVPLRYGLWVSVQRTYFSPWSWSVQMATDRGLGKISKYHTESSRDEQCTELLLIDRNLYLWKLDEMLYSVLVLSHGIDWKPYRMDGYQVFKGDHYHGNQKQLWRGCSDATPRQPLGPQNQASGESFPKGYLSLPSKRGQEAMGRGNYTWKLTENSPTRLNQQHRSLTRQEVLDRITQL